MVFPTTEATRIGCSPVDWIKPVNGWALLTDEPNGRLPCEYAVVREGEEAKFLGLSRWRFNPTQERFDWLVRNDFPCRMTRPDGASTPIDADDIDAAIAAEVAA